MTLYEERLQGLAEDVVVAAIWDPLLHPRARNGQFIRVGGFIRGLFRVGKTEEMLNGQVIEVRQNVGRATDPIIKVKTKHGELTTTASRVEEATKPKGFLSKLPWAGPDPDEVAYQQRSLDGDVVFDTNRPLEGREINGIPLSEVEFDPHTVADKDVDEPPLPATLKKQSSGVLLTEPDGRIWLVEPANHFGGYEATVVKGRVEDDDTVQQAALREAFEELGLVAEIDGYLGDYEGQVTNTRMYKGRRVGGAPWKHDFESAEVRLVSPDTAARMFNTERDQQILSDATGNPEYIDRWLEAHPKPPPSKYDWLHKLEDEYGRENVQMKGQEWKGGSPYQPQRRPLFDPGPTQLRKEKERSEALSLTEQYGTTKYKKPEPKKPPAWLKGQNLRAQVVTESAMPLQLDMENRIEKGEFFGDMSATTEAGEEIGYIEYSGDEQGVFLVDWDVDPDHDEVDVIDAMTKWLESLGVPVIDQYEDAAEDTELLDLLERSIAGDDGPAQAMAPPAAQVQEVNQKMALTNGVIANVKRIEMDANGNLFVVTTVNERIPASKIANMNPGPVNPKKPEGFDPLLPWNNDPAPEQKFLDYTLRYTTVDEGERKPRHVITAYDADGNEVGELNWYGTTGTIHNIDVEEEHSRKGLATAMWTWGQTMPKKPKHSRDRTTQGDKWAKAVGGPIPRSP